MCTDYSEVLEGTSSSHTEYVEDTDDGDCGVWEDVGEIKLWEWYDKRKMG